MSFDLKLEGGDLKLARDKDFEKVENNNKLLQDLLKIIITPLKANKAFPWYGSGVNGAIIGENFDLDFATSAAASQVRNSVENLQKMQLSQAQTQVLSPAESIVAIKDVYINTNSSDLRVVEIKVSVLTAALTVVEASFSVRL
jgi:hypothetical protein